MHWGCNQQNPDCGILQNKQINWVPQQKVSRRENRGEIYRLKEI